MCDRDFPSQDKIEKSNLCRIVEVISFSRKSLSIFDAYLDVEISWWAVVSTIISHSWIFQILSLFHSWWDVYRDFLLVGLEPVTKISRSSTATTCGLCLDDAKRCLHALCCRSCSLALRTCFWFRIWIRDFSRIRNFFFKTFVEIC